MSARNRELIGLVPVALLLTAGFAAVFAQENAQLDNLSLIYGAYFFAVCLATHIYLRDPAAQRRPLPLPAGRAADRLRPGDGLPDRRRAWPATRPTGSSSASSSSP